MYFALSDDETCADILKSFLQCIYRVLHVVGGGMMTAFKRDSGARAKFGEAAAATTIATNTLFLLRFVEFLCRGGSDDLKLPGRIATLLHDATETLKRSTRAATNHARFVRALQEHSEAEAIAFVMERTKAAAILFGDICGEMIVFYRQFLENGGQVAELEDKWFSDRNVVSFLHTGAIVSLIFSFHGQRVQVCKNNRDCFFLFCFSFFLGV